MAPAIVIGIILFVVGVPAVDHANQVAARQVSAVTLDAQDK